VIGVDTNILVRYLTQDDPVQSIRATKIMEQLFTEEQPGFVSLVAVVETAWVLQRSYGQTERQIADTVEGLLRANTLLIQNAAEVFTAMAACRAGTASFSDALIASVGEWAGCSVTLTFDRKAARLNGFALA
jgi:predicted nucleic-acid-binding protein